MKPGDWLENDRCSIARSLEIVGERWALLILREVFLGIRRFDQMQQHLGIARNILADRLRTLVDHGILEQRLYQERPPRSEYRLTEKGIDLYPALMMLMAWGDKHLTGSRGPALALEHINAAKDGTKAAHGPTWANIGYSQTLEAARASGHLDIPLGPNQGRGIASGFWFNIGGESSAAVHINEDGTASVVEGNPDIGGSRASMAMMAAEVLGLPYEQVRPIVGDTSQTGYCFLTGGSRVTFATGMAVTQAAEKVVVELKKRAAMIWDIPAEAVDWKDGKAYPAGPNAGSFEPLSLEEIALKAGRTGGPINADVSINAQGAGPGFATHICDVEVDRETGYVKVLRYTAVQDVGRAIHPSYVEGQMQGGVTQGIGWALNEEYVYDKDGRLENPGFLDYRIPVASDLPMIETVLVEVPNPRHPFGARGVGEVPIVPPMAAVANAIARASGTRLRNLPMSPPRLREALDEPELRAAAE